MYKELVDKLRTESLYKDKATLEIMDLCMDAAEAIDILQSELERVKRELEERSNGCEFCDGSERSMLFRKGACAAMNDEVYVSGNAIIIDFGCTAYDTVKIGFCPMCGRKLKGADNG